MNPDLRMDDLSSDMPLGLVGLLDQHHDAAIAGLGDDNRADWLTAIVWMSAHLAAVRVSLYPAVAGRSLDGRRTIDTQIEIDGELLDALWRLDRHLTGDVTSTRVPTEDIRRSAQDLLAKHVDGEQRLLQAHPLGATASEQEVTEKLRRAFLAAPTRPHPSMPRHRVLARVALLVDRVADRIRDTLDSRHDPIPRRHHDPPPPGKWATYLLGSPPAASPIPTSTVSGPRSADQNPPADTAAHLHTSPGP